MLQAEAEAGNVALLLWCVDLVSRGILQLYMGTFRDKTGTEPVTLLNYCEQLQGGNEWGLEMVGMESGEEIFHQKGILTQNPMKFTKTFLRGL